MTTSCAIRRCLLNRCMAAAALALVSLGTHAADLTVSAAASLTQVLRELGPAFEAHNPGTKVLFNFAASDALLAQIAKGAPVDVFAAADQESMDRADAQKLLVPGTRCNFASNALVLIAPSDSTLSLQRLSDLQKPEVKRMALGAPASVPAGRYAKGALEVARLWSVVEPKAVFAQNVRQALDYVARGEVDAGFVYATDAAIQKDKVKVAFTVSTAMPISYPVAAVAGGPNVEAARKFVEFMRSPATQVVLAKYGFQKP
jgi:molybdate transport system substrate-binding protein